MESYFLTDRGKVRETNEDSGGIFYNIKNQLLAVIADGMGGHQAGDIASRLVVEILSEAWEKNKGIKNENEAKEWLKANIYEANKQIYHRSNKMAEYRGMGTTIVAVISLDQYIVVSHIGDSRCYILEQNSTLTQLTKDHSYVSELVRTGQIEEEDAEKHPRKNVLLKALGTEPIVTPDLQIKQWQKSDRLLLCSDGLTNKLTHDELEEAIREMKCVKHTSHALVDQANERGGEDNITLIIIDYNDPNEDGET